MCHGKIMNQKGMGLIIYMILIFKVTYIISNKLENWIGLDSRLAADMKSNSKHDLAHQTKMIRL